MEQKIDELEKLHKKIDCIIKKINEKKLNEVEDGDIIIAKILEVLKKD
jgi:hypothetical protein